MLYHSLSHVLVGLFGRHVSMRLPAYLALLAFWALIAPNPPVGLPRLLCAIQPYRIRWRGLVQRTWLLRAARQLARARPRKQRARHTGSENSATLSLTPMELAVAAELNLEVASGYDEVADDAARPLDSRRAARDRAIALRERADTLRLEARRLAAQPMVYAESSETRRSPYCGPERRRQSRRTRPRRGDSAAPVPALGDGERRSIPDRRRGERRGGGILLS